MAELKFEIKEHIGTVSESSKGWTKELNIVSWNGANPKFDLRDWAPEHEKMGKGLTFTNEELKNLKNQKIKFVWLVMVLMMLLHLRQLM